MAEDLFRKYGLSGYTDAAKEKEEKRANPIKSTTYYVHDEQGNPIGNVTKKGNEGADTLIGKTVYDAGGGKLTLDASKAEASISLDKNTGKITVKAPDVVLQNETFKQSLDPVLKSLSQNYKLNPDYKYALINTDKEKDNTKTTEEWVNEINKKDLPQLVQQAIGIEQIKSDAKEKDNVDLTDEQAIRMSQVALNYRQADGKEYTVKDKDRQAIPKSLFEGERVFAGIDGYDESSHTLDYKSLMEVWNRGKSGDEGILDVFKKVDDYFKKGDFSDADEYADMTAFRSFIYGKDPDSDFLHNVKDFGEATIGAIGTGGADFVTSTLSFVEGVLNLPKQGATALSLALQGRGDEIGDKEVMDQSRQVFFKDLQEGVDEWKDSIKNDYAKLSDAKSTGFSVGSVVAPLVGQIALAVITGGATSGTVASVGGKAAAKWGAKGVKMAALAEDAATVANNTGKVEKLTKGLYAGTETMLSLSSASVANTAISESINALRTARAIETGTRVAATAADIAAQVTVDVALSNPKLARQFLDGNVTDENKAYMYEQLAWNVAGWGAGVVAGKVIKTVGSSDIGKVANAAVTPRVAAIKSAVGQRADDLKTLLHKGDADWLFKKTEKARAASAADMGETSTMMQRRRWNRAGELERKSQALESNRLVRKANREFAEQATGALKGADNWDDLVKRAESVKELQVDTIAKANVEANKIYKVQVQSINERIGATYSGFRGARDSFMDQITKVNRLESAAGLKVGQNARLSSDVNRYVNALYRLDQADATLRLAERSDVLIGAQKEFDHLQEVVATLRKKLSPELREESERLLELAKRFSAETQDVKVAEGVLNADELKSMRESGYFDNGYLRQQRVQEWTQYAGRGQDTVRFSELRGPQHVKWGDTDDEWQDLAVVLFDDVNETSRMIYRRERINGLQGLGEKVEVVVSGEDVSLVRNVEPVRADAIKAIELNTKKAIRGADIDVFEKVFRKKGAESLINTQASKTVKSGGKVAREGAKPLPRVSRAEVRQHIMSGFDSDEIAGLLEIAMGKKSLAEVTSGEFDALMEKGSNKFKSELRKAIETSLGGADEFFKPPKAEIPKLDLDEYKRLFHYPSYQDIPREMRPYMKRGGVSIDDSSVHEFLNYYKPSGYDWSGKDARDLDALRNDFMEVVSRPTRSSRELSQFDYLEKVPSEMLDRAERELIASNYNGVLDEAGVSAVVADEKQAKKVFEAETLYRENVEKLEALKKQYDIPQMDTDIGESINGVIDDLINNNLKNSSVSDAMKRLGAGSGDDLVEYATLKSLSSKDSLKTVKANIKVRARREFNQFLTANNTVVKDGKRVQKLTGNQINRLSEQWAEETADWLEEAIMQRYGNITSKLREAGSDIVDYSDVFAKIDAINQEITGAAKRSGESLNIVKTFDAYGREEWVRLSPTVADMVTTMPRPLVRSTFGEMQQRFVQLFRMGTTGGLVPASLERQLFRDTGLAITTGGAVKRMVTTQKELEAIFGEYLGEYIEKEMPDLWESLFRQAREAGEGIATVFAKEETARGAANIADSQLESSLYQFTRNAKREANAYRYVDRITSETVVVPPSTLADTRLNRMRAWLDSAYEKSETLNNMRESYLRKRVYNNALAQGLNDGMGLERARTYAEFLQAEATTNFGRQTYHLANLTKTVPYLGAAINGSKSFWRLWSFDPIGVTTRIVGGYVVPMMALTVMSLGDPENRRIYKQIPEYEKKDNLTFVLQGQVISIPIPQEVSSFIRPLQSMIEKMADANDHSFTELMVNNLVGFFPYNLEGFVNIDSDRILVDDFSENPTGYVWNNHLLPGFSKISSQLMPPLVKSGVMLVTGHDPYTGRKIDTSYTVVDPETGESLVMDYNTGELAKFIAEITGGNMSAQTAQAIFNNLFGSGNMSLIDGLGSLSKAVVLDQDPLAGINAAGDKLTDQITKPFMVNRYNEESNLAWNRAVASLYAEKQALENDPELQVDLKALNTQGDAMSEDARKKVLGRIRTKIESFQKKVVEAADNLTKNYDGGIIDKNKFATVLSLVTFSGENSLNVENALASKLDREEYALAKAGAVETLAQLGFGGVEDSSMFGSYKTNYDGSVEFVRNDPIAILNYNQSTNQQNKIMLAEIQELVSDAGLYDKHDSVTQQVNKIYAKKKKTKSDYAAIDSIYINWNAEVAKTLAPLVNRMTPEAAINNKQVRDYLYTYIEVPNSWETNNKGRYVSLGSKGNKKKAYIDSWIKSMWSVNDPYKGQY